MFARRLAIGVRSSWLASATRWRCASTERSSASRVVLKVRARRPSSSVRSVWMRCEVSPSEASSSVRRVKLATGESAVRATRAPRARPERHASRAHQHQHRQDAVELAIHLLERAGHLHGAAGAGAAGENAQVRAVHGGVREVLARSAARDLTGVRIHGHRLVTPLAPNHVARWQDELSEALRAAEGLGRRNSKLTQAPGPVPRGPVGATAAARPSGQLRDRPGAVAQRAVHLAAQLCAQPK